MYILGETYEAWKSAALMLFLPAFTSLMINTRKRRRRRRRRQRERKKRLWWCVTTSSAFRANACVFSRSAESRTDKGDRRRQQQHRVHTLGSVRRLTKERSLRKGIDDCCAGTSPNVFSPVEFVVVVPIDSLWLLCVCAVKDDGGQTGGEMSTAHHPTSRRPAAPVNPPPPPF